MSRYYITTPIYYVNDKPHIGHMYTTIVCDSLSRFYLLDGKQVFFLTGTDEHGQKVEKAAQTLGQPPQEFVDVVSANFRRMNDVLGVINDDFVRTTQERHKTAAQALWQCLEAEGQIYLDRYAGWYAVRDEAFYTDDELVTGADGTKTAPSGAPVEWVEEESYFFRLSQWQQRLLDHYHQHPEFIGPESRRNEVLRFVESGLRDLSISRSGLQWGVPVPGNSSHVMYVWFDALANYLTAAGYPNDQDFGALWPPDLHMVGKDILRFHAVYWPALLMAAGLPVPHRVFAHGWWTNEGEKISKSLGNVIDPFDLVSRYGRDPLRYFLLREVPFGQDGNFSQISLINRINADLANDFGNLAQRVLSMIAKNCEGLVPQPSALTTEDEGLLGQCNLVLPQMRAAMDAQAFHRALECLWTVIGKANRYVDSQAPWVLKKSNVARMETVLYVLAETLRRCAILAQPFVPDGAGAILDQLAVGEDQRRFNALENETDYGLRPQTSLPEPSVVFPRFVTEKREE